MQIKPTADFIVVVISVINLCIHLSMCELCNFFTKLYKFNYPIKKELYNDNLINNGNIKAGEFYFHYPGNLILKSGIMAKYSKKAQDKVAEVMQEFKDEKLKSGPGGKGGKVKSRKQAIAIALSEAIEAGEVPEKKTKKKTEKSKK